MNNYYGILEVSVTASLDQIKKAYRQKAIKYHPDKHFGDRYFAERFMEVKEAYDILSDQNKRAEYDIKYKAYFVKDTEPQRQETFKEQKRKEKEKEEQFFYDPHKPFYSYQDRLVNETPQFNPKINHWGEPLPDNVDFFKLPKNIGKIVSGYSTLTKEMMPSTFKETFLRYVKAIGIALVISAGIIFGFSIQNPIWMLIWGAVPLAISVWLTSKASEFIHTNTFIGVNGFSVFKCEGTRSNIISSVEINFKNITDLLVISERRSLNFNYQNTAYGFEWSCNNKAIKDFNGLYIDKNDNPKRDEAKEYWTNKWAERYWTIYLLDNMELQLEKNGFIEFRIVDGHGYRLYIKLGIGYITFLDKKGEVTYNFNEIKKVYTKGTNLFIEHRNYEKKFIFFESGNKNGIDLMQLSNRQFFFRAMELLLGYNFS